MEQRCQQEAIPFTDLLRNGRGRLGRRVGSSGRATFSASVHTRGTEVSDKPHQAKTSVGPSKSTERNKLEFSARNNTCHSYRKPSP